MLQEHLNLNAYCPEGATFSECSLGKSLVTYDLRSFEQDRISQKSITKPSNLNYSFYLCEQSHILCSSGEIPGQRAWCNTTTSLDPITVKYRASKL